MQLSIQPTCRQRAPNDAADDAANDAANDAIAKRKLPKLRLRSTNSLYKTKPPNHLIDHQRLKEELNLPTSQFIVCSPRVSEPIRFH